MLGPWDFPCEDEAVTFCANAPAGPTGNLEAGGVMADINSNGRLDLVAGDQQGPDLYWYENPGTPGQPWDKRTICNAHWKYHDQAVGDIDGDGKPELLAASQGKGKDNGILFYYDIPDDPTATPWPDSCKHVICKDMVLEGLAIADLDGDGENELVAGPYWFKRKGDSWDINELDSTLHLPCVALGDLNGDGMPEVVFSEGESDPARLVWFSGPGLKEKHVLADDLFHPHSLAIGDLNGDGLLDIFVAEMGLGHKKNPKILAYLNKGNGHFEKVVIDEGKATHCAKIGDIGKSGRLSIVGKPWNPGQHVDLWLNKGE